MSTLQLRKGQLLIPALALLLLALVTLQINARGAAAPGQALAVELVSGTYVGGVTVREPAPLGTLDLRLDIVGTNGKLTGQVNPIKTQVFLGGPTFTGQVTVTQGLTPTVRIDSQTFSGTVSGRAVQRRFVLVGEVLDQGNGLRGDYTETIIGFKAQPLLVKGSFLLLRPTGLQRIVTVPAPDGSTPTATPTKPGPGDPPTLTPTATTPGNGNPGPLNKRVFLPLVNKNANGAPSVADPGTPAAASAVTPTPTPTPTSTPVATAQGADQTPAAPVERTNQLFLPWVNQ